MKDDPQPAVSSSDPGEFAADSGAEFVRALYRGYLNRDPGPEEVDYHAGRLARGETVAELVANFAQSDEARIVAARRAKGTVHCENGLANGEVAPLTIRPDDVQRVIAHAITRKTGDEPSMDDVREKFGKFANGAHLATILDEIALVSSNLEERSVVEHLVRLLYAGTLHRVASKEELEGWYNHYTYDGRLSDLVIKIVDSDEARKFNIPAIRDGLLVQMAHEVIFNRGATAQELDLWRRRLEAGTHTVTGIIFQFFFETLDAILQGPADQIKIDPAQAYLFGSRGFVGDKDWNILPDPERRQMRHDVLGRESMFVMDRSGDCVVSILTSLYNGGEYIRNFLENITTQTIFRDHCELIIVDAASPQNEREVIAEFQREFPNIVYRRCDTKVSIYEAWNIGVRLAHGRYCTNANVDDCRREDSLEIQAAVLDSLPFADIAYQDVLYSFESKMRFEEIEARDLRTQLPIISCYNLMEFNSPHNAPMWRKSLHDSVGYFDENFKSAGDYDFWMRCLLAGKTFYKSNAAHVGYYVNPKGLSTRPDTKGVEESRAISRSYYRKMISPLLTAPHDEFLDLMEQVADVPVKTVPSGRRYEIIQAALRKLGSDSRLGTPRGCA